jgi:hypothetical protein
MKQAKDQLPLWLPAEAWEAYLAMRKEIKKPLSAYGQRLAISTLTQLWAEGHDPRAVLEQSIFNCWRGLFPVSQNMKGGNRAEQRTHRNLAAAGFPVQ